MGTIEVGSWDHGPHMMAHTTSEILMIDWIRSYHVTPREYIIYFGYDVKCSACNHMRAMIPNAYLYWIVSLQILKLIRN